MTSDELKQTVSMREVVERYGITVNRKNMCCCPFHNEKTPSIKIYKDNFHCYGCGADGDIFRFVMDMDHVDFKTAFTTLGGTYQHMSAREKILAQMQRDRAKEKRELDKKNKEDFHNMLVRTIDKLNCSIAHDEPFSEKWCLSQDFKPWLIDVWDEYGAGKEINVVDVYRRCEQFNLSYDSF